MMCGIPTRARHGSLVLKQTWIIARWTKHPRAPRWGCHWHLAMCLQLALSDEISLVKLVKTIPILSHTENHLGAGHMVQVRGSQQLTSHRCTVHLLVLRWSCVVPQDIVAAWGIVEGLASEVARMVSAMVSATNATDSVGCVKWRSNHEQLQPGVSYDIFFLKKCYIILLQEKRTEAPSSRVKTTPGIRGHWMPAAGGSAWLKCA